ncbi:RelA/SpoT domain-containing protein [Pedobacter sp. KR3-3]|uniref:RelA/SpoT domain-containing protein n=1 Tax=Pedobacter albus TaxID=3113905 RepID=A0ABU7I6F2_9SPHI|nr:RelA/SpoT domain-containing protein [Pedobacter sp. KR3-3]MEE1945057.1 RelA/SpoT domain-containing protein [Pedobacter sp. KR3-3]
MIHSRKKISKAGETIMSSKSIEDRNEALQIINDWRASHILPLLNRKNSLLRLMSKNNIEAIIASQRLKRLSSIEYKLDLNPNMRLGGMQDIGGYRIVVKDVQSLSKLYKLIRGQRSNHKLDKISDYITIPKSSGYRSIHFIYTYCSKQQRYKDIKLELQIRTRLQHSWATAVETVGLITNTSLKSSQGSDRWLQFFKVVSSLFAIKEQLPKLDIHKDVSMKDLMIECYHLCEELNVIHTLEAIKVTISSMNAKGFPDDYYLINIDFDKLQVNLVVYKKTQLKYATEDYLLMEKDIDSSQNAVVLVSAKNMRALKKAYPSYFLDTTEFIKALAGIQANCYHRGYVAL